MLPQTWFPFVPWQIEIGKEKLGSVCVCVWWGVEILTQVWKSGREACLQAHIALGAYHPCHRLASDSSLR